MSNILANEKSSKEPEPVTIVEYSSDRKGEWDQFVASSKNGVFLFYRDYMEYHADRFVDHSLMFYCGRRLVGLLPANVDNGTLVAHGGLTFGGVVSQSSMKTPLMIGIFRSLVEHCRKVGFKEIVYKCIPYIYHSVPADEDLYALFLTNARLMARNASSCIYLPQARKFDANRLDNIRKAKRNGLIVKESRDFRAFMKIEQQTLRERHGVKPVHTLEEMELLADRFPQNIKLFGSFRGEAMLAGVIVYESKNVAHMQYAGNSKQGWSIGAQDIIEDYLINDYYRGKKYFDFGISTERFGHTLNLGLIKRKEHFGASAVMYDTYQVIL